MTLDGIVSAKDPMFGAAGDGIADDTASLQAAFDYCYGTIANPHGSWGYHQNKVLFIPPGLYKTTAPLTIEKLQGGRLIGAGRFTTTIENMTGSDIIRTNGCSYSSFEHLRLHGPATGTLFNLNWDESPGGAALQSNKFDSMFFHGGDAGVEIGRGDAESDNVMGSENLFSGCFWLGAKTAGLKTSNFNAKQQTIIGGNFQGCGVGIWVWKGSVPVISGVGFQQQRDWDIKVDSSAHDAISIIGCRSESNNFALLLGGVHAVLSGCSHVGTTAANQGTFVETSSSPVTIERCVSVHGCIPLGTWQRLTVRGSAFKRTDWLQNIGSMDPTWSMVEVEDCEVGGTPNDGQSGATMLRKQRITRSGARDYALV